VFLCSLVAPDKVGHCVLQAVTFDKGGGYHTWYGVFLCSPVAPDKVGHCVLQAVCFNK